MEKVSESVRYELKLTFDSAWLEDIRSWLRVHPAAFSPAFEPRQVNSIYFDTPGLDMYNDHLAGVPERRKLRFRWYGEDLRFARGHVEIKNKSERAGWKNHQAIDYQLDLESKDWDEVMANLRENSSGIIRELLSIVRPTLINTYQRDYYISADGLVRITLDSGLVIFNQVFTARPNLWFRLGIDSIIILELKSGIENARRIADVLAHIPGRAGRYSKYVDNLGAAFVK
jgi:SPX domain protein involved in polyphosphate accumulation